MTDLDPAIVPQHAERGAVGHQEAQQVSPSTVHPLLCRAAAVLWQELDGGEGGGGGGKQVENQDGCQT